MPSLAERSVSQLPLQIQLKPHASLEAFVAGPSVTAVEHVKSIALGQRLDSVWLYGPVSSGRSHLLNAACRAASEAHRRAIYLSLDSMNDPELLRQLDDMDLVAVDDIDSKAADAAWERSLFSLFDSRLQRGGLVVAAARPPRDCGFDLSDLASRAGAAAIYRLGYLGDDDFRTAANRHATMRGLSLEPQALTYLLQRVSRDLGELTHCLDRIDEHSLAAQRKVTIPLLREVLTT